MALLVAATGSVRAQEEKVKARLKAKTSTLNTEISFFIV
jgi:hypothetical protein